MNKKEVLELKRRLKKDQATFSRLVGCYVDCNHEKVCKFGGKFLTLEEDEYYKYLEISNKVLSGTLGNNLLNMQFPLEEEEVGGRQQILMALRDSELNDETLLDTYYDLVIDTYDEAGNYLILLYLDSYDVMTRTKDNINVDVVRGGVQIHALRHLPCHTFKAGPWLSGKGAAYRSPHKGLGGRCT